MAFDDGAQLWMEQTCHHPPVAAFFLEGADKEYSASGVMQFSVGFGYNKMLITPQVCGGAATLRTHACMHARTIAHNTRLRRGRCTGAVNHAPWHTHMRNGTHTCTCRWHTHIRRYAQTDASARTHSLTHSLPPHSLTHSLTPTTQGERSVHFKDGTTITCDCPNDRILNLFWVCLCIV